VRPNHVKSHEETKEKNRCKIKSQLLYQLSYRGNPENIIYPVAKAHGKFYRARFWEA